ncbi:MAG: hypothetical protein KDB95_08110 [Flavobacteriales bacterium]|nr:hypothetical protein [Flavobacteriales bacterium]
MRTLLFIIALVFVQWSTAQSYLDRTLYPERLHDDLELVRSAIHEAHPDPYRYHTKAELDAVIDQVHDSIRLPMSAVEFECALRPVLKALGDAHSHVEWPRSVEGSLRTEASLLPMQVKILPEGVFLEEELKGFRSIPVGSRILAINDRPMDEVVDQLLATVVCDGSNRTYADRVVEREFNVRYHLYIEQTNSYRIRFRTPAKVEGEQVVFGMTGNDITNTRKPKGTDLLPWGSTVHPESGVLWLNLRTLDPDSLALAGVRPDRFLDALLSEAHRTKIRTLVIDARGAGGPELSMAELVFSAIAKTPFKVLDEMVVRSIAPPRARASHLIPEEHYASANARFLMAGKGDYRLPETDSRLSLHEPMSKAFSGKVYMICDGYTRDAAAALAMMVRRNKRGRLVGEEVGSNAFGFTGGPEWVVTLPTSGLQFHVPLLKYVPAGRGEGPTDRGEQPHHQAYQTTWGLTNGQDAIRSALLEMIRELE